MALLLATGLSYSPALDDGLLAYDDTEYVDAAAAVASFSPAAVQRLFTTFVLGNYHPLTVLSLALDLLALLAKAVAVTLPLLLLLVDRHAERPLRRAALMEKAPFFALSLGFGLLALRAQAAAGALTQGAGWPWWTAPFFAASALLRYLFNALLPLRLCAIYPYPRPARILPPAETVLALALVALLAYALWRLSRSSVVLSFGAAFFAVSLLLVLQIIPFGSAMAADRYLYLPSLGLCLPAGVGASRLLERVSAGRYRLAALAALTALFALFGALTWQRALVWRSDRALWTDAIVRQPGEPLAWANRAAANAADQRWEQARRDIERAFEIAPPTTARAYILRGTILGAQGHLDLARVDLDRAIAMKPGAPEIYRALALILQRAGDSEGARRAAERALALGLAPDPEFSTLFQDMVF